MLRLLVVAGILVAPLAHAQPLGPEATVTVLAPNEPIPLNGLAALTLQLGVRCDRVLAMPPMQPFDVQVNFGGPDFVRIAGPTTLRVPSEACQQGLAQQAEVEQAYAIGMTLEAPGLQPIAADVTVVLPDGAVPSDEPDPSAGFVVQVGYDGRSQVLVAQKLQECGGGCDFTVEVRNVGNAATAYAFAWGADGPGGGWTATLPDPMEVAAGASRTTSLRVVGGKGEHAFQVIVQPSAAADPALTAAPLTFNLLARDASPLQDIPAPPFVAVFLLVLGLACARRRA